MQKYIDKMFLFINCYMQILVKAYHKKSTLQLAAQKLQEAENNHF